MNDPLGDRMKGFYESRSQTQLARRTPVVIRIDGRAFSSFCKRFKKPYDVDLHLMLNNVTKHLCENVQGVKVAERHSDEISLILTDYDKLTTDAFFNYEVQKICSIVASMATAQFIKELLTMSLSKAQDLQGYSFSETYLGVDEKWPHFDARCFNIPEDEISNYLLWRIQDSSRNSVGMHTRSMFSAKEMHGVSTYGMKEMMLEKGFDWESMPQEQKTGFFFVKQKIEGEIPNGPRKGEKYFRNGWAEIPSVGGYAWISEKLKESLGDRVAEDIIDLPLIEKLGWTPADILAIKKGDIEVQMREGKFSTL